MGGENPDFCYPIKFVLSLPVEANDIVEPIAEGKPETIPAKIIIEMPLPTVKLLFRIFLWICRRSEL